MLPFADVIDWLSEIVTWLPKELRATVVLGSMAILLGLVVRVVRLRWLARSPRVQITQFDWATADQDGSEATWVTALFREQLGKLETDPLDPLPERAPSAPLVDIVEGVTQTASQKVDLGRAAGRLFRAVWPVAAYEVWGTLRPREGGMCRVSVQLVDRARRNRTLLSEALEEEDWIQGARQTAMEVAGALYPRVSKRHRGPWVLWRVAVPGSLVREYHDAQEHEINNRLAQALASYHEALDQDPLNPNLRLKIAMLQERLALNLDAWVTYGAIVSEIDRGAWSGPHRRAGLLATYRLAILLGNGQIGTQWMTDARETATDGRAWCRRRTRDLPPGALRDRTERDRQRQECRTELRFTLGKSDLLLERTCSQDAPLDELLCKGRAEDLIGHLGAQNACIGDVFAEPRPGECREERQDRAARIDAVLRVMSLRYLEQLDAWMRYLPRRSSDWWLHRPPLRRWLRPRELSLSVIGVSKLKARIHIVAAFGRLMGRQANPEAAHRRLLQRWPFPAGPQTPDVDRVSIRRWLDDRRSDAWQLHYNAACTIASVFSEDSVLSCGGRAALPLEVTTRSLTGQAIAELEEYAHRAGSARVAALADWVAFDDPDLTGIAMSGWLASEGEFKLWASHHVPRHIPRQRPSRSVDVERFTARVMQQAAREFAAVWHERAENLPASTGQIADWWEEERAAWLRLWVVCRENRSWQRRLAGIKALERWRRAHGRDELDFGHEDRDQIVTSGELAKGLFHAIAEQVAGKRPVSGGGEEGVPDAPNAAVLAWLRTRTKETRDAHEAAAPPVGERLRRKRERVEALRAAKVWTRLADALEAELKERPSIGRRRSRKQLLGEMRRSLPYTARWPNFSRIR